MGQKKRMEKDKQNNSEVKVKAEGYFISHLTCDASNTECLSYKAYPFPVT